MADPINLRRARKKKARQERDRGAAAHRSHHGQTKAERARAAKESARRERTLEGARRDPRGADGEEPKE